MTKIDLKQKSEIVMENKKLLILFLTHCEAIFVISCEKVLQFDFLINILKK